MALSVTSTLVVAVAVVLAAVQAFPIVRFTDQLTVARQNVFYYLRAFRSELGFCCPLVSAASYYINTVT